jgi:hypothetical protein
MKSIFDPSSYNDIASRLKNLQASSKPLWGKMNVAQMLHHLNLTMEAPLGQFQPKGKPSFFMKMFKSVLYNDKPFGKGSPTPKDFKIQDSFDFGLGKQRAEKNLQSIFSLGSTTGHYAPHVFFGKLTNEQWGMHFYKHTDHHLKQFGL